jgi:hypothetical protein
VHHPLLGTFVDIPIAREEGKLAKLTSKKKTKQNKTKTKTKRLQTSE